MRIVTVSPGTAVRRAGATRRRRRTSLAAGALVLAAPLAAIPAQAAVATGQAGALCAPRAGAMACTGRRVTGRAADTARSGLPAGYGPAGLRALYHLTTDSEATVALVEAYDDPNAATDLAVYRSTYGLPACTEATGCLRKVDQNGGTNDPAPDAGWAAETSMDLDTVSAICPGCRILLVEASDASVVDLGTAVNTAASLGAQYVSNSYGGPAGSEPGNTEYYDHPGVAITASSGDSGPGVEFPASLPYVTSVGDAQLGTPPGGHDPIPVGPGRAGYGCAPEPKPLWQTDTACPNNRSVVDVATIDVGMAVYDSYQAPGWAEYIAGNGSAPTIAAIYALAGIPAAGQYPVVYPWRHYPDGLTDVNQCVPPAPCNVTTGYDLPTGLGVPDGTTAFTPN